jgi:DNA (cytosine-5)-methyltransferase 1
MYSKKNPLRYIDLFCGIGGFRYAIQGASHNRKVPIECVFSSDIDEKCQEVYRTNFGETPYGDITKIHEKDIPDHQILLAGFPCQPFSIIGQRQGFNDTRGTLFFEIARIIGEKRPLAFVLENVKLLVGHNEGKTFHKIINTLQGLGYNVNYKILNALNFGLPQKRERVFIVGFKDKANFSWPVSIDKMKSLDDILEKDVPTEYYVSQHIHNKRKEKHSPTKETTIWHENKAGNISAYPFSCALRAGASYNYLLVNGERRLTSREMLRLQGFPDSFNIIFSYSQTRKQAGNSLPIPVAQAVLQNVIKALTKNSVEQEYMTIDEQKYLFEKQGRHNGKKTKVAYC